MKKLIVCPGVCGLTCTITAESEDGVECSLTADTSCGAVKNMMAALEQPLSAYDVCFLKPGEGPVYEAAAKLAHAACPVPSALIKAIEAECGLALAKNVTMEFTE